MGERAVSVVSFREGMRVRAIQDQIAMLRHEISVLDAKSARLVDAMEEAHNARKAALAKVEQLKAELERGRA